MEQWRESDSDLPWIAAAVVPAATFALVEYAEGSVTGHDLDLLAVGVPLQLAVGVAVLALVRALLGMLVRVAERIAERRTVPALRRVLRVARLESLVHPLRVSPMASNAALRGPPRRLP
jgi:hypothetical protein